MKREKQIHNIKTGVCISTGLVVSLILMGAAAAQAVGIVLGIPSGVTPLASSYVFQSDGITCE